VSRTNCDDLDRGERRGRFCRFGSEYSEDHPVSVWSWAGLEAKLRLFGDLICRTLPRDSIVLDLGCGAGTCVRFMTSPGHRVAGLATPVTARRSSASAGCHRHKQPTRFSAVMGRYLLPSLRRAHDADPDPWADSVAGNTCRLALLDGGSLACDPGGFSTLTWTFNFATNKARKV
jgi:hypothetical protein